nr:MAG TPA: hypothetical protein [Caudoviricetes sp.]
MDTSQISIHNSPKLFSISILFTLISIFSYSIFIASS